MRIIELSNGVKMPIIGFGTIGQFGKQVEDNVSFALQNGYRLIDTANRYTNEKSVGRGISKSGLDRKEIFIETKLAPTFYEKSNAVEQTLERLGVEYIDLMLLHHPLNNYIAGYQMMDPAEKVKDFCFENGIILQSWYPLGHGSNELLNEPLFKALAIKYHKTTSQIILKWHTQMGFSAVPGSRSANHILENIELFDFVLTNEEMYEIAKLNKHCPFYQITEKSQHILATTIPDVDGEE